MINQLLELSTEIEEVGNISCIKASLLFLLS